MDIGSVRRAIVALVAGACLVLTSAGSCGDAQEPEQGGTTQQDGDGGGFGY